MKGYSIMSTRIPEEKPVPIVSGSSVIINNGDLEEALSVFTMMIKKERILAEYREHLVFIPKRKRKLPEWLLNR